MRFQKPGDISHFSLAQAFTPGLQRITNGFQPASAGFSWAIGPARAEAKERRPLKRPEESTPAANPGLKAGATEKRTATENALARSAEAARWKPCPNDPCNAVLRQALGGPARTERGVTLLELLVVAVLASILLAVVFPSVGTGLRTLELRSSAQRLAAAARYARDQAIHRQRFYELEIDAEARTIAVADLEGTARRAFELPASVSIEKILPEAADNGSRRRRFLFSPDGGSLAFEIILGNQRRQVAVTSDPLTGFPKVTEI